MENIQYISEIHRILKIGDHTILPHIQGAPEGLPIDKTHEPVAPIKTPTSKQDNFAHEIESIGTSRSSFRGLVVYPAIFLAAFVFFYVILNFSSVFAQINGLFIKPQSQQILGGQSAEYYKWISQYFYAVGDPNLLAPTADIDHDGLTNYDEFIMHTNPIVADSSGNGMLDGVKVLNSINPWGDGPMTKQQREWASKLDLIAINDRINYAAAQNHQGSVAGAAAINFDQSKPGKLSIPKLKINVALIWSQDPSSFDNDLTHGVIHYPGTAMPGENGIIYVSGHSSDYFWKHDPMHDIFAQLNYLAPGDDILIEATGVDGKIYNFRYQVTGSNIYKPDDQAQFFGDAKVSKLNLSTCWPIGTQASRYVVSAVQVGL
jgi:LPXTG-site transpeptidase (sortase) family protein